MSKEALRRFVTDAITKYGSKEDCRSFIDVGAEDAELGKCMTSVGVIPGDSRDHLGRGRFFPMEPHLFVYPFISPNNFAPWWNNKSYYYYRQGENCCSDTTISFHYIRPTTLYVMDFLLYHIKIN